MIDYRMVKSFDERVECLLTVSVSRQLK